VKLVPAKVGADPKRLAILGGLVVVLVVVFLMNRDSSPSGPASAAPVATPSRGPFTSAPVAPRAPSRSPAVPQRAGSRGQERRVEDFRPTLKLKEDVDVTRIDPTLKLDLLARLKNAPSEPGSRGSVFDFGAAPPPKVDPVKPGTMVAGRGGAAAPTAAPAKPAGPPPAPPPPPIPLKYYGYSNASRGGPRRAFFLDGEDIQVAGENEMIRNRYKVIRIGVNSVVVEDTTNKNQQTLPLIEELSS
jgi:hypothetical protein